MRGVALFSGLSARLRVIGDMNMRLGSSYLPIFTGFKSILSIIFLLVINIVRALQNSFIRHSGLDPESRKYSTILDSGWMFTRRMLGRNDRGCAESVFVI